MGALSDRVGRVGPIVVGLMIEGTATIGFAYAEHAAAFILLRAAQGAGYAVLYPAFRALIADSTPMNRRGQAYAVAAAAFQSGLLLGPLAGGVVASEIDAGALFRVAGAFEFAVAALVLVILPREGVRARAESTAGRLPFSALLSRPLAGAFLLGFAGQFQIGLFSGFWSIYMNDLGASDLMLGISFSVFAIGFMLVAPFGGRLADRGERWRRLLLANLVYGAIMVLYGVIHSVPLILVIGFTEGIIVAIVQPAVDAYLASVADPRIQGRVQGAYAAIGMSGAAISALVGTVLYGIAPVVPFVTGGVVLVTLSVAGVVLVRETEQRARVRPVAADVVTVTQPAATGGDASLIG
jgi:MFS family permease